MRPPTLGEFVQQFGGAYLSTEGALWRTLRLLMVAPGELTRQYLAGRRKHYVLPLRLYLTISVVVLLLVRAVGSADIELRPDGASADAPAIGSNLVIRMGSGQAGLRDGVFFCESLPQWLCKRVKRRIVVDPKAMASEVGYIQERFMGNLGGAMFLLLPSFALWLKLAYWSRRLRYTEHLVFALHLHAFWFLALAVALSGVAWLEGLAALAVPVYTLMAMKRVYGGRIAPRLLRAAVVGMLYGITVVLAIAGVGLWTLLS